MSIQEILEWESSLRLSSFQARFTRQSGFRRVRGRGRSAAGISCYRDDSDLVERFIQQDSEPNVQRSAAKPMRLLQDRGVILVESFGNFDDGKYSRMREIPEVLISPSFLNSSSTTSSALFAMHIIRMGPRSI